MPFICLTVGFIHCDLVLPIKDQVAQLKLGLPQAHMFCRALQLLQGKLSLVGNQVRWGGVSKQTQIQQD